MKTNLTRSQIARKGGTAPRYPYKYSTQDVATATGRSVRRVRKDRQAGKFDLSLVSLARYVFKARAATALKRAWEAV